jgi:hypothetical protein
VTLGGGGGATGFGAQPASNRPAASDAEISA